MPQRHGGGVQAPPSAVWHPSFYRQVYGIENEFAWARRRPTAAGGPIEMPAAKPTLASARRRPFVLPVCSAAAQRMLV
jgi:hypothetical protein